MKSIFPYMGRLMLFLSLLFLSGAIVADDYQIGVYYYPGWKDGQAHARSPVPWDSIKEYPEREPLLGYYKEGNDAVVQKHIDWMSKYGIDFVVYDWYWGKDSRVFLEYALASFMRAPNRNKLNFSLLWANHEGVPNSRENFRLMVEYWVRNYFSRPEYLRIDNKPVIFIFSADMLKQDAEKIGLSTKDLLDFAQEIAIKSGLIGIHFAAGTGSTRPMIDRYAKDSGYQSLSAYNYHQGPFSPLMSHSYEELDFGYREHWNRFLIYGNLPLIIPMTSGWDKRPWGGSKDTLHDNSKSTPDEFELHLRAAKGLMDTYPTKTRRMGVICCWNEFGEGSYIEPTKAQGFVFLEKIKKVFGR